MNKVPKAITPGPQLSGDTCPSCKEGLLQGLPHFCMPHSMQIPPEAVETGLEPLLETMIKQLERIANALEKRGGK